MSNTAQLMILVAIAFTITVVVVLTVSNTRWMAKKIRYRKSYLNQEDKYIKQKRIENNNKKIDILKTNYYILFFLNISYNYFSE